jgi:hypothetical protein
VALKRRRQFRENYPEALCAVFEALVITLAFRRWPLTVVPPAPGACYRNRSGSVLRVGRVVDVIRPCGLTLEEVLHDPPCRVSLLMRWRIEPTLAGSAVRLDVRYGLNHAASLRCLHWERRLQMHFGNQLRFVGVNLRRLQQQAAPAYARNSP